MAQRSFNQFLEHTRKNPPKIAARKADGEGLYLLAEPNGAMYWRYDYRLQGKRKTLALGRYPAISLAKAREAHGKARLKVQAGVDPVEVKQIEKAQRSDTKAFEDAANGWDALQKKQADLGKRSPKTRARDERMVRYLNNAFGRTALPDVEVSHLSDLLDVFEGEDKYTTRQRLQSTAINVMGFAQGKGWIKFNPFLGVAFGKAYTAPLDEPRPAITEAKAFGQLLRHVAGYDGRQGNLIGKALALLNLTFVRPGNVVCCEWPEFDLDGALWTIPFAKLKQRTFRDEIKELKDKPHFVPLSRQAVSLLRALKRQTGKSRFVFPVCDNQSGHITTEGLETAMNLLGYKDVHCPHGFRSSASTLLNAERITVEGNELPRFAEQAIEFQLEHVNKSVAAIYNRDQRLSERSKLMQFWADKCDDMREGKMAKAAKLKVVA